MPFLETDEAHWYWTLDVNLVATLRCCHLILPYMVKQQYGRVVNISSAAGRQPRAGAVTYSVAKAGVIAASRSLAVAMAPRNIRVNCVVPGGIETPFTKQLGLANPQYHKSLLKDITMGRQGQPEEVAAVVLFLASDESSFMLGQSVSVDGGSVML